MNLPGIDNKKLFSLTEEGVEYRSSKRSLVFGFIWAILSGITMVMFVFLVSNNTQRGVIVVMGLLKYIPLIMVVIAIARSKSASYLADIFELEDESVADSFIEEVAFGSGFNEQITINEGKISAEDEHSPIILIGGPGYIQVNLDSVALLEKVDGTPEIIHTRGKPWHLGSFERIREIGKSDEIGKREYAIINLRDQFVRGLTVRSRTKDGIPLEAQDIKIRFSILRKPKEEAPEHDPFHFQESAVQSLVYDQVIISPPPTKATGVSFPWDTTVIHLITTEIEELIKSRNLSEILSSISDKETDVINENELTNTQMRFEMTGEQTTINRTFSANTPKFETRAKITERFYKQSFQDKAAQMGISIHWIDIGTWKLPNEIIVDELKNAWKLMRENAARRSKVNRAGKQLEMQEFIDIVNDVIISNYSKSGGYRSKLSNKDYLTLMKIVDENPDIASSSILREEDSNLKRNAASVALEILKAFRNEMIAAYDLIKKETRSPIEKSTDLDRIDKALHDINDHVFHYIKRPK